MSSNSVDSVASEKDPWIQSHIQNWNIEILFICLDNFRANVSFSRVKSLCVWPKAENSVKNSIRRYFYEVWFLLLNFVCETISRVVVIIYWQTSFWQGKYFQSLKVVLIFLKLLCHLRKKTCKFFPSWQNSLLVRNSFFALAEKNSTEIKLKNGKYWKVRILQGCRCGGMMRVCCFALAGRCWTIRR